MAPPLPIIGGEPGWQKNPAHLEHVRAAMTRINPVVKEAADVVGSAAAVDAVATLLMSLLVVINGPDGAKAVLHRMVGDVDRANKELMLIADNAMGRPQ